MLGGPIKAAAERAGFEHRRALSWAGAQSQLAGVAPCVVLVDLDLDGCDLASLADSPHVVAVYGPHVRTDLFEAAAAAGIENRLTRGQLSGHGEQTLRGLREQLGNE